MYQSGWFGISQYFTSYCSRHPECHSTHHTAWLLPVSSSASPCLRNTSSHVLALHADVHGAVSWIESCRSSLSLHEARSDLAGHISDGGGRMWHEDCGGALCNPDVLQHVKVLRDHHHLNDISGADVVHITLKVEYLHTVSGTISHDHAVEC